MKVFKRTGMGLDDINDMLGEAVLLSPIGHPNIVRVFDANILETQRGICGTFTMENVSVFPKKLRLPIARKIRSFGPVVQQDNISSRLKRSQPNHHRP